MKLQKKFQLVNKIKTDDNHGNRNLKSDMRLQNIIKA